MSIRRRWVFIFRNIFFTQTDIILHMVLEAWWIFKDFGTPGTLPGVMSDVGQFVPLAAGDFEKGFVAKLAGVLFHFLVYFLNMSLLLIRNIKGSSANLTIVFIRCDARWKFIDGYNGLKIFSFFQGCFTLGSPFGSRGINLRNLGNDFTSRRGLTCPYG